MTVQPLYLSVLSCDFFLVRTLFPAFIINSRVVILMSGSGSSFFAEDKVDMIVCLAFVVVRADTHYTIPPAEPP